MHQSLGSIASSPPVPAVTADAGPAPGRKKTFTGKAVARSLLGRLFNPVQLAAAARLQWNRKANRRSFDDAQLALYSQILPSDFLHFGYFGDPAVRPENMSLSDVTRAQD